MQQDQAPTADVFPPWLDGLMWLTVIIALIWFGSSIFVWMRRRASNLTSASEAGVHHDATPDFMKVDQKARKEALERGHEYDKALHEREKAEAKAAVEANKKEPITLVKQLSGICSLLFSVFSLATALLQVITNVDKMNSTVGKSGHLFTIVQQYPFPTAICVFVIGFQVYGFFSQKKWSPSPAK